MSWQRIVLPFTVEINPEATPATAIVDLALTGSAELMLPLIDQSIG